MGGSRTVYNDHIRTKVAKINMGDILWHIVKLL